MLRAGERVGVGVSGGADSVALLLLLVELRDELGIVLSVAHMNHKLRGAASDADEKFVAKLAEKHGLTVYSESVDVAAKARGKKRIWRMRRGGRGTSYSRDWWQKGKSSGWPWRTRRTIRRRRCWRTFCGGRDWRAWAEFIRGRNVLYGQCSAFDERNYESTCARKNRGGARTRRIEICRERGRRFGRNCCRFWRENFRAAWWSILARLRTSRRRMSGF